jgi:hypothetical protein
MKARPLDRIDVHEPLEYLPFDPARQTVAIFVHCFTPQIREKMGLAEKPARAIARQAAMQLYVDGWRSSEGIVHKVENPIPAPPRPHLPPEPGLRLAA